MVYATLIFELETYLFDESGWSPRTPWCVGHQAHRFFLIGYTLYVNAIALAQILGPASASVPDLYDLTNTGQSWRFNLDYVAITTDSLRVAAAFRIGKFWVASGTSRLDQSWRGDSPGDFTTAAWLSVGANEAAIRLTDRGLFLALP